MNTRLKADIEEAVAKVLERYGDKEDPGWKYISHPTLTSQMTDAAALVFDSAQSAQEYSEKEN